MTIFIWIEDVRQRNLYTNDRETFYFRVIEKLREIGWLKRVKLLETQTGQGMKKIIKVEIEGKKNRVENSFDGREIYKINEEYQ